MPSFLARMAVMSWLAEGESDLDVNAGGKVVEPLERVDRLGRGLVDVDQALVRADLEVLLGVLVLERRLDHRVDVLLRGQRHGPRHGRAGSRRRLDDLLGSRLDGRRVVGLEADADLVLGYCGHSESFLSGAFAEVSDWLTAPWGPTPGIGTRPHRSYLTSALVLLAT